MGRPIAYAPGEIRGFEERARHMLAIAPAALGAVDPGEKPGFQAIHQAGGRSASSRCWRRWNYPWLTAVNAIRAGASPPATR